MLGSSIQCNKSCYQCKTMLFGVYLLLIISWHSTGLPTTLQHYLNLNKIIHTRNIVNYKLPFILEVIPWHCGKYCGRGLCCDDASGVLLTRHFSLHFPVVPVPVLGQCCSVSWLADTSTHKQLNITQHRSAHSAPKYNTTFSR